MKSEQKGRITPTLKKTISFKEEEDPYIFGNEWEHCLDSARLKGTPEEYLIPAAEDIAVDMGIPPPHWKYCVECVNCGWMAAELPNAHKVKSCPWCARNSPVGNMRIEAARSKQA